jgi:hypothetical protein
LPQIQVENYAAQYGYVPQERCSLEEAYAEFLAAGSNPKRYLLRCDQFGIGYIIDPT